MPTILIESEQQLLDTPGVPVKPEELVKQVRKAKREFGAICTKFSGSVAVEILRHALWAEGFPVSPRDCFIPHGKQLRGIR
jgi:hypothetical protein